jgi:flagellar basal-body rod protein FlgG
VKALAIAATGMNAQQTNLEVIANNIANINTTGYKRARAEFSDLLYQVDRTQGVPNRANSSIVPEGVSIGLGVKTTAVRNVHTQGELTSTASWGTVIAGMTAAPSTVTNWPSALVLKAPARL